MQIITLRGDDSIIHLSKIAGSFLSFEGFIIVFLFLLSVFFLKNSKSKIIKISLSAILILTYFASTNFFVFNFSKVLAVEDTPDDGEYIVILGGGVDVYGDKIEIGKHTLRRLLKGAELYKENPRKIIVTGGAIFGDVPEAVVMKDVLLKFGVQQEDVIVEPLARNTYENAKFAYEITKDVPITIVTSYLHMKRSKMVFEKFYGKVSVANSDLPVDYRRSYLDFLPSYQATYALSQILHEIFGLIQYSLR